MSRIIRSSGNGKKVALILIILVLLLLVAGAVGIAAANSNSNKILKGVKVDNLSLDISNMTIEEAQMALSSYQESVNSKAIVLQYGESTSNFYGADINTRVLDGFIDEAYQVGRTGDFVTDFITSIKSFFGVEVARVTANISVDENSLNNKVESLVDASGTTAVDSTEEKSGDYIIIKKGHDGIRPKYADVKMDLLETAGMIDGETVVDVKVDVDKAVDIDIESLYNKYYVEKRDAQYVSGGDFVAEQDGISFNKNAAYSEYRNLPANGEMKIKLIVEKPQVTTENLEKELFSDVLGTFKTTYNASNTNRSTNLALAANSINNKIYLPGEEFSYNKELGERTAARGYKEAHVYSGGEVVDGLGGGICQISSTLYNAVLKADLEVTLRKNHMFWPEYVKPSFDATVVWNSIDFKFKNNRKTPIKIVASAKGGVATVTIYGKKVEGEPTVELLSVVKQEIKPTTITRNDPTLEEGKQVVSQSPVVGYVSEGYKVYKDANGKEIKRVLISQDSYQATNKIIKVGTKKINQPTAVVDPVEPVTPVEEPVTPPAEEPTTPTKPEDPNSQWPTGWDTPENPNYRG